jgi:uncharacterized protein
MRAVILLLCAAMLGGCASITIGESNFIRADPPGTSAAAPLTLAGLTADEESLPASGGAVLRGLTVRGAAPGRAVLYFGGNAFHIDRHGGQLLPLLAACGSPVTVFDYRGYGRSSGKPTLATLAEDALRVFDAVNARYPGQVTLHGQSLGSFLAAHVARQRPAVRALVLETTATTVHDWVDANMPWYARLFASVEIAPELRTVDNVAAVAAYQGAVLVLAGEKDRVTPPALGRRVFEAAPGNGKRWLVVAGAGHNDVLQKPEIGAAYCAFVGN